MYSYCILTLLLLYSYSTPTLFLVVSRSQGLAGGDAIDSDDEDDGVAGETIISLYKILCFMNFLFKTYYSSPVVHRYTLKRRNSISIIGLLLCVQALSKQ